MKIIADLHLHSKYSRAVSSRMTPLEMARWGTKKGIDLLATADWTHPLWLKELKANLKEVSPGIFALKNADDNFNTRFILSTEISSIYSQGGKLRRIHNLVFAPNFTVVEKINAELLRRGCNLMSDGRPIIGLSSRDLVELVLGVDRDCMVIPAHIWTPWFSLFGSQSGFDSLKECFADMSQNIYAIETGLSSDPAMNWRIKELDSRSIVSFSDAHSPEKLGREATIFRQNQSKNSKLEISYRDIVEAIKGRGEWTIDSTIEFYPQEGKYHYSGHRNCGVSQSPSETKKLGSVCPVCGKKLTIGVMQRVEDLASRPAGFRPKGRPPYQMLVPLMEILAETLNTQVTSQPVKREYERLIQSFGSEFNVLLWTEIEKIAKISSEKVALAIDKVRRGDLIIKPGYDGVFGQVKIWSDLSVEKKEKNKQMALF